MQLATCTNLKHSPEGNIMVETSWGNSAFLLVQSLLTCSPAQIIDR